MDLEKRIRIMLVEDDSDWLIAMTNFLEKEKDFEIVFKADNRECAIEQAHKLEFDVVLMDISLSGNKKDGIFAALEILQIKKDVKIIMLSSLKEIEIMRDSFVAGAVNYISKDDYIKIPEAIRTAVSNKSPYDIVLDEFRQLTEEYQFINYGITPAEKEILNLVEKGYTQSEISIELFKSERTIKNQINSMLKKLQVSSCKEALEKIKTKGITE